MSVLTVCEYRWQRDLWDYACPKQGTIVKSRGKNGLTQAKLQTNSVTTLQRCVLLLHNCPGRCCFVALLLKLRCDEMTNVTRLMKGKAQVHETSNLLQRLVLACEFGLCAIANDHNFCLRHADLHV